MSESTPRAGTAGGAPSGDPHGASPGEPSGEPSGEPRRIELANRRRAPRFRAFVVTGAVLGLAAGVVVALAAPGVAASQFTDRTVAGFLAMALALVGGLAGGAAAVFADRRSTRNL